MRLDDAEQAKYEALAEAISICLEPLTSLFDEADSTVAKRADEATLALMKLVDDAYKQGRRDNNEEWLEVEWAHLQQ